VETKSKAKAKLDKELLQKSKLERQQSHYSSKQNCPSNTFSRDNLRSNHAQIVEQQILKKLYRFWERSFFTDVFFAHLKGSFIFLFHLKVLQSE
jgi:hypothetical protein